MVFGLKARPIPVVHRLRRPTGDETGLYSGNFT